MNKTQSIDEKIIQEFVEYSTSGTISAKEPIIIRFKDAYRKDAKIGVELPNNWFKIDPSLKGHLSWVSDHELNFIPETAFKSNSEYFYALDLTKILPDSTQINGFLTQSVKIVEQDFNAQAFPLKSYLDESDKIKFEGKLKLRYADIVDTKSLEKTLSFDKSVVGSDVIIKWAHDLTENSSELTISNINVDDTVKELDFNFDFNALGVDKIIQKKVAIPDFVDLVIQEISTSIVQNSRSKVDITFSKPLSDKQDLYGLIRDKNGEEITILKSGSLLTVEYPGVKTEKSILIFDKNIKAYDGQVLGNDNEVEVVFEKIKPAVRFIGEGNILPQNDGHLNILIEAVSLKKIDIGIIKVPTKNALRFYQESNYADYSSIKTSGRPVASTTIDLAENNGSVNFDVKNTFNFDLSNIVEVEPGAIYRVELSFQPSYTTYECDEKPNDDNDSRLEDWDESTYYDRYYYPEGYNWRYREDPCSISYYTYNHFTSKNFIASNIGLIAKRNDQNELSIHAVNIINAKPISGAEITLYDFQLNKLESSKTDANGSAKIQAPHKVYIVQAKYNNDINMLPLNYNNLMSTSNYNVSGEEIEKGTQLFMYTERDVWRPGESAHLMAILSMNQPIPENYPVDLYLYDSKSNLVKRISKRMGLNGMYRFDIDLADDAPTGSWTAVLEAGGKSFSKQLKVEYIKPNRLAVDYLPKNDNVLPSTTKALEAHVRWLHGLDAAGLDVDVEANLRALDSPFSKYPGFVFRSADNESYLQNYINKSYKTNTKGNFTLKLPEIDKKKLNSMLALQIKTNVLESSGNLNTVYQSYKYSPFSEYVGLKVPNKTGYWYDTDSDIPISLVVVDENGKSIKDREIEYHIYKLEWRWWWESSNGVSTYKRNSTYLVEKSGLLRSTEDISTLNLKFDERGRYLIILRDSHSGHSTSAEIHVYNSWWNDDQSSNADIASMLWFSPDKDTYVPGETAHIQLKAADESAALVSIENGSKVIDQFWVAADNGKINVDIPITEKMAPNAYASISLIQPHAISDNDLPIRMFGVANLNVENKSAHLKPIIHIPEKANPNSSFELKVKESSGKPMTYSVFVVDEGLLSLTNYKTPKPFDFFNKKQALGIQTYDLYKYIIGAYGARLDKAFAIGGDSFNLVDENKKSNRFESVDIVLGPFELEAGEEQNHLIKVPNYVGSLKTMVVASNADDKQFGSTDKKIEISQPLMALATLPRTLSVGDKSVLAVELFVMDENIKKVDVSVNTNDLLKIDGASTQQIEVNGKGNYQLYFDLDTAEKVGEAEVTVNAQANGEKAKDSIRLTVKNANPLVVKSQVFKVDAKQSMSPTVKPDGKVSDYEVSFDFSSMYPINLNKHLKRLVEYPYGCLEQRSSKAMAQMYVPKFVSVSAIQKAKIQENVQQTINDFNKFLVSSGGFSYWPNYSYQSKWANSFAGFFLINAEKEGYLVPKHMLESWYRYQLSMADNWKDGKYASYLDQAFRLYTLALYGKADLSNMNRLRQVDSLDALSKLKLAAAYAISGDQQTATILVNEANNQNVDFKESDYITFGSTLRNRALALESNLEVNTGAEYFNEIKDLIDSFNSSDWLSTQTTSYVLYTVAKFADFEGDDTSSSNIIHADVVRANGSNLNINTTNLMYTYDVITDEIKPDSTVKITNNHTAPLFVNKTTSAVPVGVYGINEALGVLIDVKYLDESGGFKNITETKIGDVFTMEVKLKTDVLHPHLDYLMLSIPIPAGWEYSNKRVYEEDEAAVLFPEADFVDIKDDKILVSFDLGVKQTTFTFDFVSSYEGSYYMAPIYLEHMYNHNIRASKAGQFIKVVK